MKELIFSGFSYCALFMSEFHIAFEPDDMPGEKHHWVFLRDPDGNMIELQD